jgi:hypothetical protein
VGRSCTSRKYGVGSSQGVFFFEIVKNIHGILLFCFAVEYNPYQIECQKPLDLGVLPSIFNFGKGFMALLSFTKEDRKFPYILFPGRRLQDLEVDT